jgi:hypothetical protein
MAYRLIQWTPPLIKFIAPSQIKAYFSMYASASLSCGNPLNQVVLAEMNSL